MEAENRQPLGQEERKEETKEEKAAAAAPQGIVPPPSAVTTLVGAGPPLSFLTKVGAAVGYTTHEKHMQQIDEAGKVRLKQQRNKRARPQRGLQGSSTHLLTRSALCSFACLLSLSLLVCRWRR